MKLTLAQLNRLAWLAAQGGSGYVDMHGRVVAGGESTSQQALPSWIRLVAYGLVSGENGRLVVTFKGYARLKDSECGSRSRPAHQAA